MPSKGGKKRSALGGNCAQTRVKLQILWGRFVKKKKRSPLKWGIGPGMTGNRVGENQGQRWVKERLWKYKEGPPKHKVSRKKG